MNKISYRRHRFPAEIIQRAVWLCFRFPLSYRDVEDLLAERGVDVSYETIRRWALKFGQAYARKLRQSRPRPDDRWHLDEVFSSINGKRMYLWRAVDSEGEVLDILVQSRRNKKAALKLMRKLLKKQGYAPNKVVTDKLPSYGAALRDLNMTGKHVTGGRSNNRAENSHLPVRQRERRMQGFKSSGWRKGFSPPTKSSHLITRKTMRQIGYRSRVARCCDRPRILPMGGIDYPRIWNLTTGSLLIGFSSACPLACRVSVSGLRGTGVGDGQPTAMCGMPTSDVADRGDDEGTQGCGFGSRRCGM